MKKTGKIIAIIVVLALVVSGVFLFAGGRKNTAYREEIARTQDISTYYTFSGNLSTKDSQIVTSTAKTTVKECLFSEGSSCCVSQITAIRRLCSTWMNTTVRRSPSGRRRM